MFVMVQCFVITDENNQKDSWKLTEYNIWKQNPWIQHGFSYTQANIIQIRVQPHELGDLTQCQHLSFCNSNMTAVSTSLRYCGRIQGNSASGFFTVQ